MQIHELNNYTGAIDSAAYLAVDNGIDTGRLPVSSITAPLNERIDEIIAGGAAPSEAEIIDARRGADGVNYSSLGDSIRTQIDKVQGNLDTIAPNNNKAVLNGITVDTQVTGRAWYQGDNLVADTPNANNTKIIIAINSLSEGLYIDYTNFVGGGARTQLMLADGNAIGANVIQYWTTISGNITIGEFRDNKLFIEKDKIVSLYPSATYIFINIDKDAGEVKDIISLNDETTNEAIDRIDTTIGEIRSDMDNALTNSYEKESVSFTGVDNYYVMASNGAINAASDAKYCELAVKPGDIFYITAFFTQNVGLAFYNAAGTFISGMSSIDFESYNISNQTAVLTDDRIQVPENAYILKVSTRYESSYPLGIKKEVPKYGELIKKTDYILLESNGEIATFYNAAEGLPLEKLTIDIDSASTGAKILRLGKNLHPLLPGKAGNYGVDFIANSDGSIYINGTTTRNNVDVATIFPPSVTEMLAGKLITLSGGGDSKAYLQLKITKSDTTVIYRTTAARGNITFTMPSDVVEIESLLNIAASGTQVDKTFYPQIEIGSIPTKYEKFISELYTIDWTDIAGSISEGLLDVTNGVLTDTQNNVEYNILPTTITTLLGTNNIWADIGPAHVIYRADTKLYITENRLTNMPGYIVNNMSYKQLGVLSKPYICFTTDDGEEELATYTIPMVISKGVPMTFCIWSESEVMLDPTYTAVVVDAVDNHDCEIAQHGRDAWANGDNWTDIIPTEQQLFEYWETEKTAFAAKGLTPKGCACPYGYVNPVLMAEAGGYFGMNRSVYNYSQGYNAFYDQDCCGPRTNLFALVATNIKDYTLAEWKAKIDYAIAHNYLLIVYMHDADLDATAKATLEGTIDYAIAQGIDFCNLGDIPYLV